MGLVERQCPRSNHGRRRTGQGSWVERGEVVGAVKNLRFTESLVGALGRLSGVGERREGLEQLRFLERRVPMLCVEVEARGRQFWELNKPSDVPRIEAMLAAMQVA